LDGKLALKTKLLSQSLVSLMAFDVIFIKDVRKIYILQINGKKITNAP
jgi:hypothetical protein